jgi:hypothetical protein
VPEISAYHEAGHAFVAIYVGARVRSVTIEPDRELSTRPLASGILGAFSYVSETSCRCKGYGRFCPALRTSSR